jgi:DNA-binding NarL/FixJ family response regulator
MIATRPAATILPQGWRRRQDRSGAGVAVFVNGHGEGCPAQGERAELAGEGREIIADAPGYARPSHPGSSSDRHADARPHASAKGAVRPGLLIIVERRAFVRGCLTCWLNEYLKDLETTAAVDVEVSPQPDALARAAAAIIGAGTLEHGDRWLHRQVAWLRARQPDLPIMVIVESDEIGIAAELGMQLDLQGYIPAFSSLEVAAAAVRLVVAGGSYFPRPRDLESRPEDMLPGRIYQTPDLAKLPDLTSREWAVVSLLGSGMSNKVIADRLGMSLSTVKAHVHHIIRKLNVRNRTEIALLALFLQPGAIDAPRKPLGFAVPLLPRPR